MVTFLPFELNLALRILGDTGSQDNSACVASGVISNAYSVHVWLAVFVSGVEDGVSGGFRMFQVPILALGLGRQKSSRRTGFPRAFTSSRHGLY
nr:hypothetical protein BaRGS_034694 [Batillaria attramentaria]